MIALLPFAVHQRTPVVTRVHVGFRALGRALRHCGSRRNEGSFPGEVHDRPTKMPRLARMACARISHAGFVHENDRVLHIHN